MTTGSLEGARLQALRQLKLLDTPASESFDRITRMGKALFDLPIAAVSLTDQDRQWFKSRVGVDHCSIPRAGAPCAVVAESRSVVIINDLLADPEYAKTPLAATGVRFYAGAPLVTREGFGLGAMCVLGPEPREVTPAEEASLLDLAAMVMAQIELQHAFGRVDPVTGLANQVQLDDDLEDLAKGQAGQSRMLVLVDLATADQFSRLVLGRGAQVVDELMRGAAEALRAGLGADRELYHVAASQFAFLAPLGVDPQVYLSTLRTEFADLQDASLLRLVATTAVGVAPFVVGEANPVDLLRHAYGAAIQARGTPSRVGLYRAERDNAHARRIRLIDDFAEALKHSSELRLVFQPRVDLGAGTCVGAEALLRWTHPELGPISPGEFIPLVEETELAKPMTAWVLNQAADQILRWREEGRRLQLSVNVSANNLQEAGFAARVLAVLSERGLEPAHLELELTESAVIGDSGRAMRQLRILSDAGVTLAIDDFGTGYSSLSYLQSIPATVLKIDQSFIREVAVDERRRTLVRSMIALSHDLGYRVVAEGIETAEIADILRAAACDEVQGYHFGRPMSAQDFERWLAEAAETCPLAAAA